MVRDPAGVRGFGGGRVGAVDALRRSDNAFEAEVSGGGRQKPTVILDAGIATEENIGWLGERGYGWICVSRETLRRRRQADVTLTTSAKQEVMASGSARTRGRCGWLR